MESSFPRFNPVKQCFLQRFVCLSCFSAAVAKENLLKTPAIASLANLNFVATSKVGIGLAICEFFRLLTNQNV